MAANVYGFSCGASGYVVPEDGGNIFVEAYSANCHACSDSCPYVNAKAKAVYLVCGWDAADSLLEEWGEGV